MLESATPPDILLLSPQTAENLLPAVTLAEKRGIPVVNIDGALLKNAQHWIGAPNYAKGEMAAQYLMEQRPEGGPVLIIMGMKGIYDAEQRTAGFAMTLKNSKPGLFPEVDASTVIGTAKNTDTVSAALQSNNDIIGIYCNNDTMALGATEAVDAAGKTDQVVIIGTDGIPDAIQSIKRKDSTRLLTQAQKILAALVAENGGALVAGRRYSRALFVPQRLISLKDLK